MPFEPNRPGRESIEQRRANGLATTENIEDAVTTLLNDRQTFARFRDAVNLSLAVRQTHFPMTIARWYSQSVLMGLRRIGDRDPRTHSLRALLDGMILNPEDWDIDAVISLWPQEARRDAETLQFAVSFTYGPFADSSGRSLNTGRVLLDRDRLDLALSRVKLVVNKTIAHAERTAGLPPNMTFDQLDESIDSCHELVKPYITLLTGRSYNDMTPVEAQVWWRIFAPWQEIQPVPE